jgi:hypothetical protein
MNEAEAYLRARRRRRRPASAFQDAEPESKPAPQRSLVTQGARSPDLPRRTLSPDDVIRRVARGTGVPWRRL